jgi:signal peptidase II
MRSFRSLSRADEGRGMLSWLWIAAVVVAIDQLTKWMAEANLEQGVPHQVFPHFNLTLAYNYGAAFSFLGNQNGWQRWFFAGLAVLVIIFIINWLRKLSKGRNWTALGLVLVLGGAVGNLIDRVLYGKVIDFIDVYFDIPFVMENYRFATFNVADIAITLGAMILVFMSLFASDRME